MKLFTKFLKLKDDPIEYLYLCTMELFIGDRFHAFIGNRISNGIIEDECKDKWRVKSSFSGVYVDKKDAFKVIGKLLEGIDGEAEFEADIFDVKVIHE